MQPDVTVAGTGQEAYNFSMETTDDFGALIEARILLVLEQIRLLTAELREATLAQRDTPTDDEHDPEGSTVSAERASDMALLAASEASLAELMDAKTRLVRGSYGICERCGKQIPAERLRIRPEARFCVSCAAARRR